MIKKNRLESTVIVAIIALVGTFSGYIFDSVNKRSQQQREFESTLIINAVETGNSEVSKNNLKFLIDANLISDKAQQIKLIEMISDSTYKIYKGAYVKPSKNDAAFICLDSKASKYHRSKDCRALRECGLKILELSVGEAKSTYDRELCGWED